MGSKYHSKKTLAFGEWHDSKKEAIRHGDLLLLERAGKISNLQYHKERILLIPAQKDSSGKVIERAVYYEPDFVYEENGVTVYEDTKGVKTDVYKIKRKLVLERYGIRIRET